MHVWKMNTVMSFSLKPEINICQQTAKYKLEMLENEEIKR